MTNESTTYITQDDYYQYRDRQDADIRAEFAKQHQAIEQGNDRLRHDLVQHFDSNLNVVEGTLSGKLGLLNSELGTVKHDLRALKDEVGQVKDEVGQVKDEVGQVKDEVGQVKDEVGQVKDRLGYLEARLSQMDGRSYNKLRYLPWHDITSIGIFRPGIGMETPADFPKTIKAFWSLKSPRNGK
jgi:chromosome segregation ATPase